jgi:hypothetical protein
MLIDNNELIISLASFEEAMDLKDAVEEAAKKANIKLGFDDNEENKVSLSDDSLSSVLGSILSIDSSKEVRRLLFKCAERCLFNKEKIDQTFFEVAKNREYYYPIMFEILKETLMPFFKGLFSKLKGLKITDLLKNIQK